MYDNFAYFYDKLMRNADYDKRTAYVLSLFKQFDRKPALLLDLCCGTGTFSEAFSKDGISVIGVDVSEDMLSLANEKATENGTNTLYLHQDAKELDLYGTVDGAVCLMDSLNHITDYADFCEAIKRVSLFLEKDRLFIFDLNTEYKAESILGNNAFVFEENGVFLSWQNDYDKKNKTNTIYLDFFAEEGGGIYRRKSEEIAERAYTGDEIERALTKAGLKIEAVYEDMKKTPPTATCQRAFYVTRKL